MEKILPADPCDVSFPQRLEEPCGFETGELRAADGFWTKIFNIQTRRFTTVSCTNCHFTELYTGDSNMAGNVLDFFTN